jgi:hypothetical protein
MPHRKPRQSPEGRHVRQTPARLLGQLNAALGKYDVLAFKGPRFTVRVGQGSKKFHPRAGKLPCPGRGIGAMARRIPDVGINGGGHDDYGVSRRYYSGRLGFVGRIGPIDAGKLVDAT